MAAFGEVPTSAARIAAGPGALLRESREAQDMSREELSKRTRLELKVIDALENEQWEKLAGPAFIKGYIRSISRELGVDPNLPLTEYNAQFHTGEPVLSDFESRAPVELTTANRWIKAMSIGLVAVGAVLVAVWWQHNYLQPATPPEPGAVNGESASRTESATPLPYSWTVVEHSSLPLQPPASWRRQTDGSTPPPLNPPPTEAPAPAIGSPAQAPLAGTAPGPVSPTTPGPVLPTPAAPEPAASAPTAPVVEAPPPPTPPEVPAAPPEAATPRGTLVVSAALDSWVKISDAKGKEIWSGVVKAGRSINVKGRPPLRLYASKAGNVSVTFQGKPQVFPNTPGDAPATLTAGDGR